MTGIWSTDVTPPLSPVAHGGVDVASGAEVEIIAAAPIDPETGLPGRIKTSVNHAGADGSGNLWFGFDQTAVEDVGEWLEPGGRWEEYYAGAVRVRNTGAVTIRVTWMEWGA